MDAISKKEFDIRQPYYPAEAETDGYYLKVANDLYAEITGTPYGVSLPESHRKHLALALTGYLQDIISDCGIWRSFINANRYLYGRRIPFHECGEDYVDYELNREDIRFLVWYDIAMLDLERRLTYPLDTGLIALADTLYGYLDSIYDNAPVPEDYNVTRGLELNDPEDQQALFHLAQWLFNSNWLMTPAYALTLSETVSDPDVIADKEGIRLQQRLEAAMTEDPTGPLAYYIPEWIRLIVENRIALPEETAPGTIHPYYEKFIRATGGREIAYFADYEELNDFFIKGMQWSEGEEHLPQMKGERNFVLLVNRGKGMLLAKDVARCIADPDNPLYDGKFASSNAIFLLTARGVCPADLLKYIYAHGWLPDAVFPSSDDRRLVSDNHDFIARCYLQQYYRGD